MSNLDLWKRPLSPFNDVENWMNGFFRAEPFAQWPSQWSTEMRKTIAARCEVSETPQSYLLKFEIPGMKKEDIKIDLHDNRLTVSGERREEKKEEKDHKVHYSEMGYGSFMRSYTFPTAVDAERVEARYENGVLSLNVAKSEGMKARQITVK